MNSMQTDANGKQQWMVPFGARPSNLMWFLVLVVVLSGVVLGWQLSSGSISTPIIASAGLMFTISLVLVMRSMANPDSVRARQTGDMLKLSRQTLACLKGGLDEKSAQKLCSLLFPNTDAVSVCITDKESVLGYEGLGHSSYKPGDPIFATTIAATAEDGEPRTLLSHDDISQITSFYTEETPFDTDEEYLSSLSPENTEFSVMKDLDGRILSSLYTIKGRQCAVAVATREDERGRGHASRLINSLPFSYLFTEDESLIPFYEKLGFSIAREYQEERYSYEIRNVHGR